ncbi:acetylornithine deacetylase [Aliiruegeria haliotis]|uniref:Acetylornithine deacetylase n=1 Tax=Aliiruegeria haliotis TaxID=1280846 RepID=A0A2T0RWG0_9RHOB|nr:acetylornithine deacetylase [Aliiruegeria haliotis]PRY25526.1 acetylornithine deacetylase [Aliiruegeria haliotis]
MSRTLEILDRLIAFPTVSADSNLSLIDYVQELLQGCGFQTHRMNDESGTKAGLFASIGPAGAGGVMLSAHSDVVPVDGQRWRRDPFRLTRDGSRLHGRGATDMKGFLASALALAERVRAERLREPLKFSISWDEEVGCKGLPQMLPFLDGTIGAPRLCIVGEPTSLKVGIGHKGKAVFRAKCHGQAGHSAMAPDHVNALHLAAEFIQGIRGLQADLAVNGARDPGYEIPYTTVHVGRISGGTALNIVPELAILDLEYRNIAGDPPETIADAIGDIARVAAASVAAGQPGIGIEVEKVGGYPGLDVPEHSPAIAEVARCARATGTLKVGYGTEAGYFAGLGIPTLVCGPGSMAQGHVADEYIERAQIDACDRFMERLHERLRKGVHEVG